MPDDSKEPKIHTRTDTIPHGTDLTLTFKGEQYKGLDILDTRVEIESGTLCWITWEDREAFTAELKNLIEKYAI